MSKFLDLSRDVLTEAAAGRGGVPRSQQIQMLDSICAALEGESNLAVQAHTGVGKSIAYLSPVLSHAVLNDTGPIVLGTATLALQRQIVTVDAEVVTDAIEKIHGKRPRTAVLKGWGNYLCRYLLEGDPDQSLDEVGELFTAPSTSMSSDAKTWKAVAKWAKKTDTGDRDDLDFPVSGALWSKMSISRRECIGSSCPFSQECFPANAKEKAFDADLVVTNHAVIGIAINSKSEVLPEASAFVIDEAHSLADAVRNQATVALTERSIASAARALRPYSASSASALEHVADKFEAALSPVNEGLVQVRPTALSETLHLMEEAARDGVRSLSGSAPSMSLQVAKSRLDTLIEGFDAWVQEPTKMITWVTKQESGESSISVAPLHVSDRLANGLLDVAPTIFTSATLTLGATFAPMIQRLGLELASRPYKTIDVGGPFDARKQGILYVPKELPIPGKAGVSSETVDCFVDLVKASGGGALGLFTSRRAADEAVEALRANTDFEVLAQGEDSLSSLVSRFRENPDSCLIGSRGLWQGVDVRGKACRLVVMDRIPFPRPDDPVTRALGMAAEKSGRSGFFEASLVPAALLMAQGAGRLLRSGTDRGVVVLLDPRLTSRSYGAFLLQSMPDFWRTTDGDVARAALKRLSKEYSN